MRKVIHVVLACFLAIAMLSFSIPVLADDPPDDGGTPYPGYDISDPYSRDPTKFITQEYFGNEWVNTIPSGVTNGNGELIMSPWEHHGYIAGSPAQLTPYDGPGGTYAYFTQLAERSPRVTMWTIGNSYEGRPMYFVAISDEATIADIDTFKANINKLADPRLLGYPEDEAAADAAAEALIADRSKLKPVYWVWGKQHSTETGGSETTMEFAYRMAVQEDNMFKDIRKNVITIISDNNPDGTQMVNEWVNQYMQDPEWKDVEPRPPYYNNYTQHDNNRDTHTHSQPEQYNMTQGFMDFPATVCKEIHESVFLLYIFSGQPPWHPATDPIAITEQQWLAARELNQMEQFGNLGVSEFKMANMYYPFYGLMRLMFRNSVAGFYEVYGHTYPTTITREAPFRLFGGLDAQRQDWFNPKPYKYPKLVWSFRNNINYAQTALLTTAVTVARNREILLKNFWQKSKNAVSIPGTFEIGCSGPFTFPYAYVVPTGQKDMPEVVTMINNLLGNGIEIHTANSEFTIGGTTYPAGSFIMSMAQPYSRLIYALLSRQYWPEDVPPPYDATAFQYDLLRDVECDTIDDPAIYDEPMTLITADLAQSGTVSAEISEGAYVIDHNSINNIVTLVFGLDGYDMFFAEDSDGVIDVGDVIIPADQAGVYTALTDLVPGLGLTMHSESAVAVAKHQINVPSVAMFHSWNRRAIQDGGWSRFTFEQYDIPYTLIQRTDVLAGNLKADYDVIFLSDTSGSNIKAGITGQPEVVWHGPVTTTERCGGLGDAGIAELKQFVDDGGMLICNNASCDLPIDNGFIEWVTMYRARMSGDYYFNAPGPIMQIEPDLANPVCYGYDEKEFIYQNQSPVFVAPEEWVAASYTEDLGEMFVCGKAEGVENMAGKAAIVTAPAKDGTGNVVLFGTDITYRWQVHGAYTYLWNAILNWDMPIPEGTEPSLPPGHTVGLTVEIPSEEIIAISVEPTEIDFGIVYPGEASDPVAITVENIGDRAVDVEALLDPAGTVFENLTLDDDAYGSWEIDLAVGASDVFDAVLEVPPTYTPQGEEEATLIFEAAAS